MNGKDSPLAAVPASDIGQVAARKPREHSNLARNMSIQCFHPRSAEESSEMRHRLNGNVHEAEGAAHPVALLSAHGYGCDQTQWHDVAQG